MEDYYQKQLDNAQVFQDFAYGILATMAGMMTVGYSSKLYQHKKGENKAGIEIKQDMNRKNTGNLYIEIAEKADPSRRDYVAVRDLSRLQGVFDRRLGMSCTASR